MFNNNNDDNYPTFNEFCEAGNTSPKEVITMLIQIYDDFTEDGVWARPGGNEVKIAFEETICKMEDNEAFSPEMAQFVKILVSKYVESLNDFNQEVVKFVGLSNFEGLNTEQQMMATIAENVCKQAVSMKLESCLDNGGPIDIPAGLAYIKPVETFEDVDSYVQGFSIQFFDVSENSEEDSREMKKLRSTMIDCYASLGEASAIAIVSDSFQRVYSEPFASISPDRMTNLGKDFLNNPDSDVVEAILCMVYAPSHPLYVTTVTYHYDDDGTPSFDKWEMDVAELKELENDLSDKGKIAKLFHSFFENTHNFELKL